MPEKCARRFASVCSICSCFRFFGCTFIFSRRCLGKRSGPIPRCSTRATWAATWSKTSSWPSDSDFFFFAPKVRGELFTVISSEQLHSTSSGLFWRPWLCATQESTADRWLGFPHLRHSYGWGSRESLRTIWHLNLSPRQIPRGEIRNGLYVSLCSACSRPWCWLHGMFSSAVLLHRW